MPVRVAAIRGTNRDGHREERQQRGREVGSRVRRLGEQPEARAREPGDELDHDEETRGPDRDERGAPLRRHAPKARAPLQSPASASYPPMREGLPELWARERGRRALLLGLRDAVRAGSAAREERKVVTCLFCDLVGFTARAERMDPEDVRRLLQPYHALVRAELERFGGTVEKFIGDAAMAIFGAPIAHEDDPERAVRAALAIRETLADDGQLEVRIGITTGEALVALDARPEAGEGIASGDVVNTAARIQAAAPPGGLLVDETTMRATERAIEYAEPSSIDAKGKSQPVAVWQATRARARVGVERLSDTPLVGRERELSLLREHVVRVSRRSASRSS